MVFELNAGERVPVAGVQVYCDSCGPSGHSSSVTDDDGGYRLEDAPPGVILVFLAKAGYRLVGPGVVYPSVGGWMGAVYATVNADTRFDVEIVRQ